jgi:hypothetical protein
MRLPLLALGLLIGCPDPNATSSGMETTAATGSDPTATGSQETDPSAARLSCSEGDTNCITISGTLDYAGQAGGSIRLDVQKVRTGSAPMLIHTMELQSQEEAFSFDAPKGYGKIIITGFIDEAGDGPSPNDPQGRLNIEVGQDPLTKLIIEVKANNAPVQPKPPEKKPEDKVDGAASQSPETKDGATVNTEAPPADNAPPADDAPPADE